LHAVAYDYKYLFTHAEVVKKFLTSSHFENMLEFIEYLQGCYETKRSEDSDEDIWIHPVSLELTWFKTLQFAMNQILDGKVVLDSDQTKEVGRKITKHIKYFLDHDGVEFKTSLNHMMKIITFSTYNGPITTNLPLHRYLAYFLFANTKIAKLACNELLPDSIFAEMVLEHPLRLSVLKSHVKRRCWERNHKHIREQSINYLLQWPAEQYFLDVFLMQSIASIIPADRFYTICMDRFRKDNDLFLFDPKVISDYGFEEDFLWFLMMIYTDRHFLDTPDQTSRKVLLHALFSEEKLGYSDLKQNVEKQFRRDVDLEEILEEIAELHLGKKNEGNYYTVKDQFWSELDMFYPGYFEQHYHDAEERFIKKNGKKTIPVCFPSKTPFDGLNSLMTCQVLHKIIFLILYRTVKDKSTTQLLNYALRAMIYALKSDVEDTPVKLFEKMEILTVFDISLPSTSLRVNLKHEVFPNNSILSLLSDLSVMKDTHHDNLVLIGDILKEVTVIKPVEKVGDTIQEEDSKYRMEKAKERQRQVELEFAEKMKQF
jgi:hypothetical protein